MEKKFKQYNSNNKILITIYNIIILLCIHTIIILFIWYGN